MKPGLQTYSVRTLLTDDFEGTLKSIAKIGYKQIEGYGLNPKGMYYDKYTPKQHAKVVEDLGMEFIATHCSFVEADKAGKMIEAAAESGMKYLIIPSTPGKYRDSRCRPHPGPPAVFLLPSNIHTPVFRTYCS